MRTSKRLSIVRVEVGLDYRGYFLSPTMFFCLTRKIDHGSKGVASSESLENSSAIS